MFTSPPAEPVRKRTLLRTSCFLLLRAHLAWALPRKATSVIQATPASFSAMATGSVRVRRSIQRAACICLASTLCVSLTQSLTAFSLATKMGYAWVTL